jgi:hypothetical protein
MLFLIDIEGEVAVGTKVGIVSFIGLSVRDENSSSR